MLYTYLFFRGKFYKQIYGTAMGSPVSVIVANMVMEYVEEKALSTSPVKPIFMLMTPSRLFQIMELIVSISI